MIKLFASDMDGTLLDETHLINDRTAQAVLELQKNNIEFIIATGRDFSSANRLVKAQNIHCAMINLNGALIHDENGNVLYECPIEESIFNEVIQYLTSNNLFYSLYTKKQGYLYEKETYIEKTFLTLQNRIDFDNLTLAQLKDNLKETKDAREYHYNSENPTLKMMIISENADLLNAAKVYLESFESLDITSSGPGNLEVTHKNAQKGLAIKAYINQKGIDMNQVVTIGDSLNDRSMLKDCPNSYAMENASDEVKKMAVHLAPANDQFGVAIVIEDLLNKQP